MVYGFHLGCVVVLDGFYKGRIRLIMVCSKGSLNPKPETVEPNAACLAGAAADPAAGAAPGA